MKKLLQLIKDNARADGAGSSVRMESQGDTAHIYVHDVIDAWWGASAEQITKALAQADGRDVTLHINSPGGDVFESLAMASSIAAYKGKVTALVEGLAASAATRLALAASEVQIVEGSLFMIHNSWTMAWGNKSELRDTADLLDKIDTGIVGDYTRKTGSTEEQVRAWMDAETWFTASEAKEHGFVDAVLPASQVGAKAIGSWNLSAYANAPKPPEPKPEDIAAQAQRVARFNRSRLEALTPRT